VFQFYVVLPNFELRHLHVQQDIQRELTDKFRHDAERTLRNKHIVSFGSQYPTAQKHELLVISDFSLSEQFRECVEDSNHCDDIEMADLDGRHVKAIVGAVSEDDGNNVKIAVFKELSGTRILDRSPWNFFLHGNTLTRLDRPGVAIPEPVHAVYQGGELYFFSYETARKFVDLTSMYTEAAEEDLEAFLEQGPVIFRGGTLREVTDSWCLRRISMVLSSRVWTRVTVQQIQEQAATFGVILDTEPVNGEETIVLPEDRASLKDVLKVLNQDFFYSLLDHTPMYAGIKVPVEAT
jgi:hypothetical protein